MSSPQRRGSGGAAALPAVRAISVKGFRGIESIEGKGLIEEFSGVNVFVGRNNSGKSTLLEAVYLTVASNKRDLLGRVPLAYIVKRRGWYGLRSLLGLFYRGRDKSCC